MSAEPISEETPAGSGSGSVVAGYLATFSIFCSVIALAWHPLRMLAPAIILALVAAGMGGRSNRLARYAIGTAAVSFVLSLAIAVAGSRPLF
jgi:hypothetical protein